MSVHVVSAVAALSAAFNALANGEKVTGTKVPESAGKEYAGYVFVVKGSDVFAVSNVDYSAMVSANVSGILADQAMTKRRCFGDITSVNASIALSLETAKEEAKKQSIANDDKYRVIHTGTNGFVNSATIVAINATDKDTPETLENKAINRLYATGKKESAKGSVGCWSLYHGKSLIETFAVATMRYSLGTNAK